MLGDGVVDVESAQPREGWCWPNLKGQINQRPTCLKDNPKETWCRCAAALNPGLPARPCLQEMKSSSMAKPNTFQICWTIHFEEVWIPKNLLLRKVLTRTICELKDKTPSLTLGKVTLPLGKLESRSLYAETSSNQNTNCGPRCSAAQKGEWLCRVQAQGEHN